MSWNIQGLRPKIFNPSFKEFCNNYDIFALSEINKCPNSVMAENFPDYEIMVSRRSLCKGGGVAVFVRKMFVQFVQRIESCAEECVFCIVNRSIIGTTSDVLFCFPYIAHEHSNVYEHTSLKGIDLFEHYLLEIFDKVSFLPCIIAGDMNARAGILADTVIPDNLENYSSVLDGLPELVDDIEVPDRLSLDEEDNTFGRQLVQFCKVHKLCILNGRTLGDIPGKITCIANGGKSIVDNVVVSISLFNVVERLVVKPRCEADHFPVCLNLSVPDGPAYPESQAPESLLFPFVKLKWKDEEKVQYGINLAQKLSEQKPHFLENVTTGNIDEAVEIINKCIEDAATHDKPDQSRNYRSFIKSQPGWFDSECEESKQKKFIALENFHRSNSMADLHVYRNLRRAFKSLCKSKKREFDKIQAEILLENSLKKNSKDFWSQVKFLTTPQSKKAATITPTKWQAYFQKLLNPYLPTTADDDNGGVHVTAEDSEGATARSSQESGELNEPITDSEVKGAIKKLKAGKACGPDGIAPEFYMYEHPVFIEFLVTLFNAIFESGIYPTEWTKSAIFALHKKGSTEDANNYRGISLLNVFGKVFSHVLNARLVTWCDQNEVIPEAQGGFRAGYSTVDNIFVLQSLVQKYIGKAGGRFYVLFIDFCKAFDLVDREKLWYALRKQGCHGNMQRMLMSMYKSVLASVRVLQGSTAESNLLYDVPRERKAMYLTEYFECLSGVKQGCILSPILFSIFISELEKELSSSVNLKGVELSTNDAHAFSLLYADDVCIFADSVIDLQRKINWLETFCAKWRLKINTEKSKVVVFRNGGYLKGTEKWFLGNERLESVTYYSYLGLIFSSRLCWSKCVENHACKALRVLSFIRRMFNRLDGLNVVTAFKIFDCKVKPILLYGAEIWGTKCHDVIDNVQVKFCKAFLGVGKTTPNCLALSEVGRYPLSVDYKCRAVKYWCKLLSLSADRYPRKCYVQQYRHAEMGRKNWAAEIKHILFSTGFGFIWNMQHVGDTPLFLNALKHRLCAIGYQDMQSEVRTKYESYLELNPFTQTAHYITVLNHLRLRRLVTLLRTQSFPVRKNLKRIGLVNDDICSRCTLGEVDDEIHLLFRCTALQRARNLYLPIFSVNPSIRKFIELLTTTDENMLKNVTLFLETFMKSFSYKKDRIY